MRRIEQILDEVSNKIDELKKNIEVIKMKQIGKILLVPVNVNGLEGYEENYDEIAELLDEVTFEILGPILNERFFRIIKEPKCIWTGSGVNQMDLQEKKDFFGDNGEVNITFEATIENGAIAYKIIDMNFSVYNLAGYLFGSSEIRIMREK